MFLQRCAVLVLLVLGGCDHADRSSIGSMFDQSMPVPQFSVAFSLSTKAAAKLSSLGEGITVTVFFDGDGDPDPSEKTAPHRDVFLGYARLPLGENNTVTFSGLTVPTAKAQRLKDPDYYVGVNGASARLSHPMNLLSCGFVEARISEVSKTGLKLHCSLIEEEYPPRAGK